MISVFFFSLYFWTISSIFRVLSPNRPYQELDMIPTNNYKYNFENFHFHKKVYKSPFDNYMCKTHWLSQHIANHKTSDLEKHFRVE